MIIASSSSINFNSAYRLIAYKIQAMRARLPAQTEEIAHCNDNHRLILGEIRTGMAAKVKKFPNEHIRNTQDASLAASNNKLALTA